MTSREQFLNTLKACHQFPGPYTFKIIGDNQPELLTSAIAAMTTLLPNAQPQITRRQSGGGNHQSITIILEVPSAETVYDIYEAFRALPGIRVLL